MVSSGTVDISVSRVGTTAGVTANVNLSDASSPYSRALTD